MDKSFILNVIDMLKKSEQGKNFKVYAIVAPSISSQFSYAKLGQVISGLKQLGFYTVVEAALGADMVAQAESREGLPHLLLLPGLCGLYQKGVPAAFALCIP